MCGCDSGGTDMSSKLSTAPGFRGRISGTLSILGHLTVAGGHLFNIVYLRMIFVIPRFWCPNWIRLGRTHVIRLVIPLRILKNSCLERTWGQDSENLHSGQKSTKSVRPPWGPVRTTTFGSLNKLQTWCHRE